MLNKTEVLEILQKLPDYEQRYAELLSSYELEYIPLDIALDWMIEERDNLAVTKYDWSREEIPNDNFSIKEFINILVELENKGYSNLYFDADCDEVYISVSKETLKSEETLASQTLSIILYLIQAHRYDLKYQIKQLQSRLENE